MIDVGRLNKRISFIERRKVLGELGQKVEKVESVCTVWGSLEPVSGKEYYDANKASNQTTYNVYIRYRDGINTDMLIRYKNRKFHIISVLNIMEKKEILKIVCFEKEGDSFE